MANFICPHCGTAIIENEHGEYVTGCEHYPIKFPAGKRSVMDKSNLSESDRPPSDNCVGEEERKMTIEELSAAIRQDIKSVESKVCALLACDCFRGEDQNLGGVNIPATRNANMKANITLAFRHLEDARMRLGKVMQAYQGGVSILDK